MRRVETALLRARLRHDPPCPSPAGLVSPTARARKLASSWLLCAMSCALACTALRAPSGERAGCACHRAEPGATTVVDSAPADLGLASTASGRSRRPALAASSASAASTPPASTPPASTLPSPPSATSATAVNPPAHPLFDEALQAARGVDPEGHARLRAQLQSRSFLDALDTAEDYANASRVHLRFERVATALAENLAPSARKAFLRLLESPLLLNDDERALALVRAGVGWRPAPAELIAFWNSHSRANDGFTPTTITVLVENGSAPALALLGRKLLDVSHSSDEKLAWLRSDVLTHRNDLGLLQLCRKLLLGGWSAEMKAALVEVVFDYQPQAWYRPATVHSPPPLSAAAAPALVELESLGQLALKQIPLNSTQRAAVAHRLNEVRALSAHNEP
ncbi:MAG TPA: hypothetical protein VFQ61_33185 [Polyangiaceae bacterium]|nr:hypothetical protein [Polyangiaceae bacterium]